jgi:hypothetical protein
MLYYFGKNSKNSEFPKFLQFPLTYMKPVVTGVLQLENLMVQKIRAN